MEYSWGDGARFGGSAQETGEHLEAIRTEGGGKLVPRDVVVAARPEASPLHRHFEWRDPVAALKWREEQARQLIRAVVVTYDEAPEQPVRAFVCVENGAEGGKSYQATKVALTRTSDREYVLAQALRELNTWKRKYQHLTELASVFQCLDCIGKDAEDKDVMEVAA